MTELTPADLEQYSVWELAIDEEGLSGQDEETVRPRPDVALKRDGAARGRPDRLPSNELGYSLQKPDFAPALLARGTAALTLHRGKEAATDFERVLVLNPDSQDALLRLGQAFVKQRRLPATLASDDDLVGGAKSLAAKSGIHRAVVGDAELDIVLNECVENGV